MADDLTPTEKKSAVAVALLTPAVLAGVFFLFSLMAHSTAPAPKSASARKAPGGKAAPAAAKPSERHLDASSPLYWIAFFFTLGLCSLPPAIAAAVGAGLGMLYGLETALLASYDLSKPLHGLAWIMDLTWSLPNTIFGFVIGNPFYFIMGSISRRQSRGQTWVSFEGSLGNVLQTLGTLNLGGAGCHELVHLLQARILGPLFLGLQLLNYILNGVIQILWTLTIGMICYVAGARRSPWFRPSRDSAVKTADPSKSGAGDFFGWIYRYTLMEIWGYGVQPAGCGATP